jgi:hypothetical protein
MNRRGTVATVSMLALVAAGVTPAIATVAKAKPKDLKGSWSFTDFTPDPTVSVMNSAKSLDPHCDGTVPASPLDVNAQKIKVAGRGVLTVLGDNTLDWAMEVLDPKGMQLASSDGGLPQDKESVVGVPLRKAGTYTVVFCNLGGAPTADATYTYKYR